MFANLSVSRWPLVWALCAVFSWASLASPLFSGEAAAQTQQAAKSSAKTAAKGSPRQAASAKSAGAKKKSAKSEAKNSNSSAAAAAQKSDEAEGSSESSNAESAQGKSALPPPSAVVSSVQPSTVRLGEPFTITVQVTHPEGVTYAPARDFSLGSDADILDVKTSKKSSGGEETTTFTIQAAVFKLGDVRMPDLKLFGTDGLTEGELKVDGPSVTCEGDMKEGETASPSDILPPVEVGIKSYTVLWGLLIALLASGLIFALIRLWKKRKPRKAKAKPAAPPEPLHVRTLSALKALLQEGLHEQGRERELFFRLSEIERGYLGERYGIGALDMTSEELLCALRKIHAPGLDFEKLEKRCRDGDFVRFAKAPLPPSESAGAVQDAISMVMATTQREADRLNAAQAVPLSPLPEGAAQRSANASVSAPGTSRRGNSAEERKVP